MGTFPAGSQVGTGAAPVGVPSGGSSALRPNGARRGGSQYGPPRCIPAQPFLQTSRPVGFRRAAARKEMGTFLISPLRGQKGTDVLQVCPLLLGNEECPHFFPEARATLRAQRESAVGRRPATLKSVPVC